jgi:hypothetical protein
MNIQHKNMLQKQEAEALAFSRPLDVHRWSDYPEADAFVDHVYDRCQNGKASKIEKKHFKVVLLDLYVAWLEHPDLKLAVSLRPEEYKAKGSRYNALHISRKTIDVVNLVHGAGLIEMKIGYYDRRNGGQSRRTRIWPSPDLTALFEQSQLDAYKIGRAADQEVIVLRDEDGKNVEYQDTPETLAMRQLVRAYNELLSLHFIDIRRLDQPWIELSDGSRMLLGPSRQQVYRVFNRSNFDNGGRFFGPWWQQCPKEWRREIFINDAPTIEQDYSSLHIALLYARKGVNFYGDYSEDAYHLDTPSFLPNPRLTRMYAKTLLLMAVNAKDDKAAFAAFRSDRNSKKDKLGGGLTDDRLATLLNGLKTKHPVIADDLGSDAGIKLMNEDSRITEHVIKRFTERGLPVLTIHDSYIVHFSYHDLLQEVLEEAFSMVTGMTGIRSERTGVAWADEASWETQRLGQEAITRSEGYSQRLLSWMVNGKDHGIGDKTRFNLSE